jgi:hypothetical protein
MFHFDLHTGGHQNIEYWSVLYRFGIHCTISGVFMIHDNAFLSYLLLYLGFLFVECGRLNCIASSLVYQLCEIEYQ